MDFNLRPCLLKFLAAPNLFMNYTFLNLHSFLASAKILIFSLKTSLNKHQERYLMLKTKFVLHIFGYYKNL